MPDIRHVAKRLGLFFLPVALVAIYSLALYEFLEWEAFALIGALMVLYFITPIGKYLLIPGALLVGLNTVASWIGWSVDMPGLREMHAGNANPMGDIFLVAFSVAFIDMMCSMFLVNNFDLLQMIPVIGKWLRRMEEKGAERLRRHRQGENLAFLGLTGFVSLSVQGSGGIMSTLMGRMAGMRGRIVFAAITAGSLIGCFAIACASYYAGGAIMDSYGVAVVEAIGYGIMACLTAYFILTLWRDRKPKPGD